MGGAYIDRCFSMYGIRRQGEIVQTTLKEYQKLMVACAAGTAIHYYTTCSSATFRTLDRTFTNRANTVSLE